MRALAVLFVLLCALPTRATSIHAARDCPPDCVVASSGGTEAPGDLKVEAPARRAEIDLQMRTPVVVVEATGPVEEAEKIIRVKEAEAEAESKGLAGKGVSDQRKAIVEGLRQSVGDFQKAIHGATPQDVMNLILMTQYFDTLKDIGAHSKSSTVFMPHTPGHVGDLASQIQGAMITGDQVSSAIQSVVPSIEDPRDLASRLNATTNRVDSYSPRMQPSA